MVNQEDPSLKTKEVMLLEMIEENKDASDVVKKIISKEIVWQRMSICIKKRK